MSMDGVGFDTSARCVDVLNASDEPASKGILEKIGGTGRGTYYVLGRKPATNPTNEP
jgi:hypothetical protein